MHFKLPSKVPLLASREQTLVLAGVVSLIVATLIVAGLTLSQLHHQVERRVAATTQNLVRSVVQTFDGLIDSLDVALASAAAEIEHENALHPGDTAAIDATLRRRQSMLPIAVQFRATNAQGEIIYGDETPFPHVKNADREYFRMQRDNARQGLFVGKPIFARIASKWMWVFSRRVNHPDGAFAGIVFALVDIDEIYKILAGIQVEDGGSISLRDGDRGLIARYPATAGKVFPIGETHSSEPFLAALARDRNAGTYRSGLTSIDGIDRTYSYQRSARYGFLVNVGLDVDSSFAEWRRQAWTVGGLVGVFSLAMSVFAYVIQRAWRYQEAAAASLREAQRIARLGSYRYDLRTQQWTSSDVFDEIFGIDASYPRDAEHWDRLVAPEERAAREAYTVMTIARDTPYQREYRVIRQDDGAERWISSKAKVERGRDGIAVALVGTVQDITERKRVEEDLRIAAIAFESQEAMIVTDAQRNILRVNRAFMRCTGYTADEVIGRNPRLLRSHRHDADFFRAMWQAIDGTGGWQGEIWDRRKDGEEYQKWLTISAVCNEAGVVTHYVGAQHDITEKKRAEERIHELAFFDQLTGLPNRTLLLDRLRQAMTASERGGTYGALLLIDLDRFKTLNDTLGHDMGDLLLKQVAQRMNACLRAGDTAARIGGDEFVVVLGGLSTNEETAANQTKLIGSKLHGALAREYALQHLAYTITPSIGACLFRGQQSEIDVLMKQADLAMYRAKEEGRNGLRFFDQTMEDRVLSHAALERDLRTALAEQQFSLHYQAQITRSALTGAEVLLRWHHPQRGAVSPAEFIPCAEETGQILPLGDWVLETACRQLAAWAVQPQMSRLTLAVNVSAQQLRQDAFVDRVLDILAATGAPASRLKLELTESMLVANVEAVIGKMLALKERGVLFSLDDFGTGYSSLYFLKRLPLDQLKIDQSFTRGVRDNAEDASIVRAIVMLANSLGLKVIAEGVESEEQRTFLDDVGCYAYQGYLFSRPLPLPDFERFARQQMAVRGAP